VARFSRSFVSALRALDDDAAKSAIGEETPGAPLLSPRVLAGVAERRRTALGIIDRRIAGDSEAVVLAFD
jgi:hypothetical protein